MTVTALSDPNLDLVEMTIRSIDGYETIIREGVSRAVDEVVDPIRSGRWSINQLTQPEKTVIGIRVENALRMDLGLPRATRLDIVVADVNVDVKFTINTNWAIPKEADGEILLLTRFDESAREVWAGLQRARPEWLNRGENRDTKRGLNSIGRGGIRWLVDGQEPESSIIGFMARIAAATRELVTDPTVGAQERINRLFQAMRYQPIPETVVQAIAQHFDWTRRLRPDASNPKAPDALGFEVLRESSPVDRRKIQSLGLSRLPKGYCMSIDFP